MASYDTILSLLFQINKVISSVSYYSQRHMDDEEWLTADKMAVSIVTSNLKLVSDHYRRYYIKKNISLQRSRSYMPIRLYLCTIFMF